jgi:hypothetical protein
MIPHGTRTSGITPGQKKKDKQMLGKSLWFAAVALALGVLAAPASAAPVSNLKAVEMDTGSAAERVHYYRHRHCRWHHGHWHCRRAYYRPYYYAYGPSFRFYFGGHRHRHWGHRHW